MERPEACRYYLSKKKRYCRLEKMKEKNYCVQHIDAINFNGLDACAMADSNRIRCPLDPSHTCDKRKLQKHLKICNVTKLIPTDPWYVTDINSGKAHSEMDTIKLLKDVSPDYLRDLITRIRGIFSGLPCTTKSDDFHPSLACEMLDLKDSETASKKLTQNSNLLAVLESNKILLSPCNYIEFGAGRGQLTTSIIKALPKDKLSDCTFVLVDRGTNRRKLDSKYRQIGQSQIVRLRTDIKDLCLQKLDLLQNTNPVVGVSKHLCGCATDLTLRCVVNSTSTLDFNGGLVALCCHHRCNWLNYVGKDYFAGHSLTATDFSIICLMSSWAVCCFRDLGVENNTPDKGPLHFISSVEKVNIGLMSKRLIDFGRVEYMSNYGYSVELLEYTTKSVTLENVALVFTKKEVDK